MTISAVIFQTIVYGQSTSYQHDVEEVVSKADQLKFIKPDSSYLLFRQGIQLCLSTGDTIQAINLLISLSDLYAHNAGFGLSYDHYWEALLLADKTDNDDGRAAVYSGLGWLYSFYERKELAIEYFNKSATIRKKQVATDSTLEQLLIDNYFALVTLYRKNKNIALCKSYVDSCKMVQQKRGVAVPLPFIDAEIGYITYYEDKPKEALEILLGTKNHFTKYYPTYAVILHSFLGEIYQSLGVYDSSEYYYKSAIETGTRYKRHMDLLPGIYQCLSELYHDNGDYKLAYEHLNQSKLLAEQHFGSRSQNNQHFLEIKDEFRTVKEEQNKKIREQRLEQLEHESKISYLQSVILIGTIFFLVLSGFLLYRYLRTRYKAEKKLMQRHQEMQMQKTREMVEVKNKELTVSALQVIEREELLSEVKTKIQEQKDQPDPKELGRLVKSIDLNKANNWREFEKRFISVNQSFYIRLRKAFPNLNQSDQRLCALVKLNFSSKDMSRLLGISIESVHTTRYRLRKKLGLEKNANLSEFISNL